MRARRWTVLVAGLALTATGCAGGPGPGTAAEVGRDSISTAEVDRLTAVQCRLLEQAVESGQQQPVSLAVQKQQILATLIQVTLSEQLAAAEGSPAPEQVRGLILTQQTQGLDQLDADARDVLRPVIERIAVSQADLAQTAADAAGEELSVENLDQALQAGQGLLEQWQAGVEVQTDARYAPGPDGLPGGGDGSVSLAASDAARAGADGSAVADLPASQRCGG